MWKETGLVESLNDILEAVSGTRHTLAIVTQTRSRCISSSQGWHATQSTSASETCELARTVLGKISPSSLNQAKKAVGQT